MGVVGVAIVSLVVFLIVRRSRKEKKTPEPTPAPSLGGDVVDDPKTWSIERLNYEIQQVTGKLNELDGMLLKDMSHEKSE